MILNACGIKTKASCEGHWRDINHNDGTVGTFIALQSNIDPSYCKEHAVSSFCNSEWWDISRHGILMVGIDEGFENCVNVRYEHVLTSEQMPNALMYARMAIKGWCRMIANAHPHGTAVAGAVQGDVGDSRV
jgi:hypothetical protein